MSLNILLAHLLLFFIQVLNLLKPEEYENTKKVLFIFVCGCSVR